MKEFAKIQNPDPTKNDERKKLLAGIDQKCAEREVPFAVLSAPNGANLLALATECAEVDVTLLTFGDYRECFLRQHECLAEELLRFEAPRAEGLLGLLNPPVSLRSPFCP